jgi:hypothetical protein
MKTIQKITLALLTVVSVSSLSAATFVSLDTAAGDAEMAGAIDGNAKKIGANILTQSGIIDGNLEVAAGSVLLKAAPTGHANLNGGNLEVFSSVPSINNVVMTSNGVITSQAALDIGTVSGTAALGLLGAFDVTMAGTAYLANCSAAASLDAASAHIQAGSVLPATASFSGDLHLDADVAAGGAVTASGRVLVNSNFAAGRFGSLTASSIIFAVGTVLSQDVILG